MAVLDILVHLEAAALPLRSVMLAARIEESLIADLDQSRLPENWIDEWARGRVSPVLRVPSAIVTSEYNFLISPLHRAFPRLKIAQARTPDFFRNRLVL